MVLGLPGADKLPNYFQAKELSERQFVPVVKREREEEKNENPHRVVGKSVGFDKVCEALEVCRKERGWGNNKSKSHVKNLVVQKRKTLQVFSIFLVNSTWSTQESLMDKFQQRVVLRPQAHELAGRQDGPSFLYGAQASNPSK
eukprot:NODE_3026_length_827_cov_71.437018_g2513_i0.p2 GENE.NODE_3026_length_827_cov_71.437018_g2513_i0~~NODE_3026_length_827_cov_71.437018_g2513_i0.p2  ORF type:complete len:143 (+),score=34.93 NODE_3026_length_827_cov_71.437018_g2513_i0:336-764(+)